MTPPTAAKTLVELLRSRARLQPDDRLYTFLAEGEEETGTLTYGELDRRARALAVHLADRGLAGERALLLHRPGLDLIVAFFGCLYAGTIAVPAYPPRQNRNLRRLHALAASSRPAAVLTDAAVLARVGSALEDDAAGLGGIGGIPWLATDELAGADPEAWRDRGIGANSVAFLQYTSGSTAAPKGVVLTHAHLLANQRMIERAFAQSAASTIVGWLPLQHDMGLIGNLLQPLWLGARCVLMPPTAFLQRPLRWLQAISRYRGTTSGGPDFAYDLCARRIAPADREGLDLSSWSLAFNGAEPVRAETLDRFAEAFAPCGFRREAFYPCYGLAEATLFVAGGTAGRPLVARAFSTPELERHRGVAADGEEGARRLVGCGGPPPEQELAIVNPESRRRRADGEVGEIWVRGPGVASGYWENDEETERVFHARLADGDGPFLRTGDLGFVDGGELFVTGRLKDLIILRGRNVYPQDIERAIEASHPALRAGGAASFSIEADGEERLVVIQEIERGRVKEAGEALVAIARAVAEEVEAQPHEVVLLRAGTLLKTSSGKVQRRACRDAYLRGELDVVARSGVVPAEPAAEAGPEDGGDVELWLRAQVAALARTGIEAVPPDASLASAGLDSLGAVELASRAEAALGVVLPLDLLLQGATLRELAERLAAGSPAPADGSVLADLPQDLPLTPGQRGLWFLQAASPASAAYQIAGTARVLSPFDPDAFARAVRALADRHPALRTTFPAERGEPRRRIAARGNAEVEVEDATRWSEERVLRRLNEAAFRPFDLANGPLLRALALPRADGPASLLLAVHHLVADLWSMAILVRDLGSLYDREAGLAAATLPAPAVEPVGRSLVGAEAERLWEYWRERLAGAPAALDLPADHPRLPSPGDAGAALRRTLDADLAGALRSLARERGATLFAALLAGLEALLFRWSGQEDFVVGVPTSGRGAAAAREAVGYFVEPLPLRADLSGDPGFAELLERARAESAGGLAHAGLPLSVLAERLRPERAAGRMPLFEVLFAFQQVPSLSAPDLAAFAAGDPAARIRTGSLELAPVDLPERRMQLDLLLQAAQGGGGITLALEYRTERFEAATVERLLGGLETLLRAAAGAPDTPVAGLPLLAPAERLQVLGLGQGGEAPPPVAGLLHEGFFLQAGRTPDAAALIDGEKVLTYAALRARAERLAERLRRLGVGPEDRVGVCLERSSWLVASLLGVLAAGGAYVPLPPEYPAERLELLARDAGVTAVVTRSTLRGRAPATVPWLDLDAPDDGLPGPVPGPGPLPENLAYLIYTSGSTGMPKGVAIEHRAAALLVAWARRAFSDGELAGVLAATAASFDLSVFEMFAPLSLGGAVILAPDALRLPELAARDQVTLVNTVPSVASELIESAGWPSSVRTVNLAGEALTGALARRVYTREGVRRVLNLYGPSEDTTYSTELAVAPGASGEPTIGLPLPGKRAYVVDRNLEPLPSGVPGELLLGGGGLARGYFDRPGLTADRFVPDPFSGEPGARLYRTGDLARRRSGGELEFLGRLDRQVKLRGYRVEPGEIESALAEQPGVREAVVMPRAGRLVAWVAGPEPGDETRLREALSRRLPSHLVPSAFVLLPSLPRTPHGKVDRKALTLPSMPKRTEEAAGTPEEEILAAVFARLLGLGRVGADDSFFDLGGHSLLAMRLLFEVREAFGRELTVTDVFESPTPAALARRMRSLEPAAGMPPIERLPRGGDLPVSFGQRRLWLLDRLRPGLAAYNVPGLLRLLGRLDECALEVSLAGVLTRHETLRATFAEAGGEPVQRIAPVPAGPLRVIDLAGLGEERTAAEADRIAFEEARRPFDLARGPLHRFLLLRVGTEESRLVAVLHHAVCDGASLEILLAELAAGYRGEPLPALPVQYADFAASQRRRPGQALERDLDAWRRRLDGAPPAFELPGDRPRPAVSAFRGGMRSLPLPAGTDEAATALARRGSATLFMTLAAVAFTLLRRVAGEEDLVLGTPVAGRRPEVAGLIGFFVNTLPLRCDLPGDPTFSELLESVRRSALDAYARQDVPFERLVEELRPARDLARSPIFQVMLLLERPLAAPELPGLAAEVRELHNGSSKFDLTFAVRRQGAGLAAACEYDTELFDAATADRLLERFGRLLLGAAAEPGRRLSELPLLSDAERAQLLEGWQGAPAAKIESGLLHERVLAQAVRTPGAVALIGWEERWTYARLAGRVEEIAARLRALGAGPERIVGVCLDRTPELVAALLAVLRAGAAYLPLDPSYPRERLAWMLEDAGACVVLTRAGLAERLPEEGAPQVTLEDLAARPAAALDAPAPDPRNLAYLIYTSGSTGRPKAVAIEHRSAAALVEWASGVFAPEELARVLAATSVTFDLSVFEMFVPLSLGGAAVVAENALVLPALSEVTLVNTVPSVLAEVLHRTALPPGVRSINLAGEALPRELVRRVETVAPAAVVRNLYGPSEDTTYSTWTVVGAGTGAPAIGRPLPGTRTRVLDRWLALVPPGSPGELWLGGDGLARGYLGRPDLTAERFVPDPFGDPGDRLYRTGDLVRHRPDGELEYLGRADHQIKVRGFRVEPGEVEAALEAHPAVRRAAVLARGDAAGRHLVAFVAPAGEPAPSIPELRAFLRRSLPEALVPSELISLPSLPLTAHGKVDRKALAALSGRAGDAGRDAVPTPPRTPLEEEIAAAFAELLERERVGIHDDFFDLGGHSLLAHRLLGRLRDTFGVELPLRSVFESPTVAGMALEIARTLLADAGEEMAAAALAEMEPR